MKPAFAVRVVLGVLLVFCSELNGQGLFIGTNYHPHDSGLQEWKRDIALMKEAGFNVVRMGHLAWDSYEPTEGRFRFGWFDTVMTMMHEAGIQVILDIAIRPAPLWVHHKYPSIDIVNSSGDRLYPNHRYMDDVGDPVYQAYALRYADTLSKRYGTHPALLAFGIDNESGDGEISYSETARTRFISWLKKKYSSIDSLNTAWAGQRWSRRISEFDEIGFPVSGTIMGAPERVLDFRRFVSDEINDFLFRVIDTVRANAPHAFINTNAWYFSQMKYFDYAPIAYSGKMTREGEGFYPGPSLVNDAGIRGTSFGIARIQYESTNPFWCTEFTTMSAVPNSIRKSAYASLMFGNQMVCGWTWQSMHGGEEQYLEGMIDWDGVPNRKYEEYKRLSVEFRRIGNLFPYQPRPEIGLAFSFPSQIASYAFPELHESQVQTCFDQCFFRNLDVRMVDLRYSDLRYKLLVLPGVTLMDPLSARKVREYVSNGGSVIMTGYSAMVDTTNKVFASTHPGLLDDVFGIRVGGYEEPEALNELSRLGYKGQNLRLQYRGKTLETEPPRFDTITPRGAEILGFITSLDKDYPVITSHQFGKGRALYIGIPARAGIMDAVFDDLVRELSITRGPTVPREVMARHIDNTHDLYLNMTNTRQSVSIPGGAKSVLTGKEYKKLIVLEPFEPECIELR
jgi:beta-galactosidase